MSEVKNIPKHWQIKKLGEVADYINGRAFKPTEWEKSGKPIIRIQNLNKAGAVYNYSKLEFEERYKVFNGDLLYAWSASLGVYLWNGENAWLNQHIFKVVPKNICDKKYLFYTLEKITSELYAKAHGSGMVHVTKGKFEDTKILLPPLSEQQLIVSKIEELLSDLDNGKQQLLTAQQQLKVYRQSLLKWAFEGKVTKTLSVWQNVKFDEVANAIDPQPSHRTPPIDQNGVPFVSIKDFDSETDKIDFAHARKVSPDVLKEHLKRYKLEIGDFVIGKIGTIGKPVRIVLPQNYTLSANIVLIQPRKVNATYLYYFFQSSLIEKAFTAGMNSTTQAAFGIQKVRELRIELPNKEEQQQIVDELESKLTVCDKIEETISQSLLQAETLRQSILKKAFEGKLVSLNYDSDDKLDKHEMGLAAEKQVPYKTSS